MKVLISDKLSPEGAEIFEKADGVEAVFKSGMNKEELLAEIPNYDALVVRSSTKVTEEVLAAAANLKVIGRAGIGVDNIDVTAASRRGVIVMNTPLGNMTTTAEHAIALMLSLARSIPQAHGSMSSGAWNKKFMGVELTNKTMGVIGLGRIGSIVAQRAKGLAMQVLAHDPFISSDRAQSLGVELMEIDEILEKADFLTVHVPKTDDTRYLIGEKELAKMKRGIRIINCARGGIIDEKALLRAIDDGQVAGAALDVYETEPLPEDSPLRNHPKIICTPHLGAATDEAQVNVAIDVANQIVAYHQTGEIHNAVNVPSIPAETLDKVGPFMALAENIGKTLAQLVEGGAEEFSVTCSGEFTSSGIQPVTISALKGFLDVFIGDEGVNIVNTPVIAKERGIKVHETITSDVHDFTSLLSIRVKTDKMEACIDGTVFGKKDSRIVRINEHWVEASPTDYMIILSNDDSPGVIGKIGTTLGEGNVNIAGMQLARNKPHGKALSIVNVDSDLTAETLEKLRALPELHFAKMIKL